MALRGHLPHVLQLESHPSCLLLFKGAGSEGGGVLSCWKAELKGPHPGDSQVTGQGHTETSSQRSRCCPLQQTVCCSEGLGTLSPCPFLV